MTLRASNADQLHCLNLVASAAGLHRGMPLTDVRAICPVLSTRPADPVREGRALEGLRRWANRYGPHAAKDGSDGLIIDISGVPHLFVGSEAGGKAAAIAYTLIETAKLNAVDPQAWLADTTARIPDYKITKVDDLLPWRWNG